MDGQLRALVVGGSVHWVDPIVGVLRRSGRRIEHQWAGTTEQLATALDRGRWDVVLSDYELDGREGLSSLELVRRADRDVPFILVADAIGEEEVAAAFRAGASDFVLTSRLDRLSTAVFRAIEERLARQRAAAELERSELSLRVLLDQIPAIVFTFDRQLRLTSIAGAELTRYQTRDVNLLGQEVATLVADEAQAAEATAALRCALDGKPAEQELHWGQQSYEFNVRPLPGPDGQPAGVVGVGLNVAERRTLEAQLHVAQRMEAIGTLAGGVAHDYNNMLAVILTYGEFLREQLGPDHTASPDVEAILDAAQRSAALTEQLLIFSRRHILSLEVLDVNAIVGQLDKMLQRLIGEDIRLVTTLGEELWPIKADKSQLEQMVMNLAVNARDAMPGGGTLTIETANVVLDDDYAAHHVGVQPGPYVMLAVTDTGCGMDEKTRSRIFEPFFTTKDVGRGTGLGLATLYATVQRAGGNVWVYSEVGKGTTFKLYLPRGSRTARQRSASRPLMAAVTLSGSETILVVEDDDLLRAATCRMLSRGGYRVLDAGSGGDALIVAEQFDDDIDLLLTDVVMPHLGGRDVARRLAMSRPEMGVLYMSGYTDEAIVQHGVLDEDVAFVQKPFTPQQLLGMVRGVLDEG